MVSHRTGSDKRRRSRTVESTEVALQLAFQLINHGLGSFRAIAKCQFDPRYDGSTQGFVIAVRPYPARGPKSISRLQERHPSLDYVRHRLLLLHHPCE
jgi:hypothetical protein